jgi:hypothetical protein
MAFDASSLRRVSNPHHKIPHGEVVLKFDRAASEGEEHRADGDRKVAHGDAKRGRANAAGAGVAEVDRTAFERGEVLMLEELDGGGGGRRPLKRRL